MYPHRIRLRGPWECEALARVEGDDRPLPPPLRMTIPCRWRDGGLVDFAGRVRFSRRFGYPGRIDAHERVWLTFAGVDTTADVRLNGHPLGCFAFGPFEFEVTSLLQARNELVVEVESAADSGGLWGEVALEVRCTAYLRGLRIWVTSGEEGTRSHVAGALVGSCERPLDLYVVLDRSTVTYATLDAVPEGRAFHLTSEPLDAEQWQSGTHRVRVELVNGATVWYAAEEELNA